MISLEEDEDKNSSPSIRSKFRRYLMLKMFVGLHLNLENRSKSHIERRMNLSSRTLQLTRESSQKQTKQSKH